MMTYFFVKCQKFCLQPATLQNTETQLRKLSVRRYENKLLSAEYFKKTLGRHLRQSAQAYSLLNPEQTDLETFFKYALFKTPNLLASICAVVVEVLVKCQSYKLFSNIYIIYTNLSEVICQRTFLIICKEIMQKLLLANFFSNVSD